MLEKEKCRPAESAAFILTVFWHARSLSSISATLKKKEKKKSNYLAHRIICQDTFFFDLIFFCFQTWIDWNIIRWMILFHGLLLPLLLLLPPFEASHSPIGRTCFIAVTTHGRTQRRERGRARLSHPFLIVTSSYEQKRLLITDGRLRTERTRNLLRGFLCQWKSLLYSLLLCESVFYYSELFLRWSLSSSSVSSEDKSRSRSSVQHQPALWGAGFCFVFPPPSIHI